MTRRRGAIACAAGLVVAVSWWAVTHGRQGYPAGPLDVGNTRATSIPPRKLGEPVTIGDWALRNPSGQPAVVDRITPNDMTPGLIIAGIRLAYYSSPYRVGTAITYPPPHLPLYPVGKLAVPPHNRGQIEIIIGLKITKPGTYTGTGLTVEYHIGSTRYQTIIPEGFGTCWPIARYPNGCPAPLPSRLE